MPNQFTKTVAPRARRTRNRQRTSTMLTGQVSVILDATMPYAVAQQITALLGRMKIRSLTWGQSRGVLTGITGGKNQQLIAS